MYSPFYIKTLEKKVPVAREIVVVVGYGWVGQANALALTELGYQVFYYDPGSPAQHYGAQYGEQYKKVGRLSTVREKDGPDTWYMVCVGDRVSDDGVQDISLIERALDSLTGVKGGVILRSTILPEKLGKLTFDFYVPEFLHEKKAVQECIELPYFIVGFRGDGARQPSFFDTWKRTAPKVFYGTPEEASYIKYLSNVWNALRIAFVNEFGNAMMLPTDEKKLADIERVLHFFFEHKSYLKYGRSFGGHCLPKDTRAFVRAHKDKGREIALLEGMWKSNDAHMKVEKQYPHLPEWFSEWVRPQMGGFAALKALGSAVKRRLGFVQKV